MSSEQIIESNFRVIQTDLADMKASMSKMADALSKIAVLEERHQSMSSTMFRIMEKLERLDEKYADLHLQQVKQETTVKVTVRAIQIIWGVLGTAVMYGVWQIIKLAAQG